MSESMSVLFVVSIIYIVTFIASTYSYLQKSAWFAFALAFVSAFALGCIFTWYLRLDDLLAIYQLFGSVFTGR